MIRGLAIAAVLAAAPASAAVVYNNGAPNTNGGNEATAWVQAEDFVLPGTTTITGAGVYLGGYGGVGAWDGQFQYYLFASGDGTPGTLLQSGSVTATVSDGGPNWCCGGNAALFSFNFASPFTANAGTTYYLGIHAAANYGARRDLYWITTGANNTSSGFENQGGVPTSGGWSNNGNEHAFFLTSGAVPEPASWAMLIAGFGLVGAVARRRRHSVAA